ncbi:MAG: MFS transporter [Planctomycetes bacterium]|nr:MFS transporter [Planctomycetota bacterium]MBL7039670.1 MFS transporter [Pirellulaceae bacterium]
MDRPAEEPETAHETAAGDSSMNAQPKLYGDRSFWGITGTQFLGAFNDNLYKQLLLLLLVAVPVAAGGQGKTRDLQWLGLLLFSLPFILFSGYAGYLSDRWSKRRVIVAAKVTEIVIMAVGVAGFFWYAQSGLVPVVVVALCGILFLMGGQSAFFGPGKYGILPEMLRERDLPAANGLVLMTTFLAIIFGSAVAGVLMDWWGGRLWLAGLMCVGIAGLGTATSLAVRRVRPSAPQLRFQWEMVAIPRDMRRLLAQDEPLRRALIVSIVFWLTAAIVQPAVNALGILQLGLDNQKTSFLVTIISFGIAMGSAIAGAVARGRMRAPVQRVGAWGMVAFLVLMAARGGPNDHLLGYWGSLAVLCVLGMFTGMFAVPLQVFLQARPPEGLKGRMIATQNLLNWIGIFASSGIYWAGAAFLRWQQWPENGMFALAALLMLPVALCYRPEANTVA